MPIFLDFHLKTLVKKILFQMSWFSFYVTVLFVISLALKVEKAEKIVSVGILQSHKSRNKVLAQYIFLFSYVLNHLQLLAILWKRKVNCYKKNQLFYIMKNRFGREWSCSFIATGCICGSVKLFN